MSAILENKTKKGQFIGIAPMEGVTDYPMRLWLWLTTHASHMTTPFLRVTETYPPKELPTHWLPESLSLPIKSSSHYSCTPQLMAPSPKLFIRVAERCLDFSPVVELNCGCPSPKVVGHGAGSSIMRSVDIFASYLEQVCQSLPEGSVSIKIRTGFSDDLHFEKFIETLKDLPLNRLIIHGRTRVQKYTGKARWDLIEYASQQCSFPVIGSGDVVDSKSYVAYRKQCPSSEGILIGRGVLRNPWLWQEIAQKKDKSLNTSELLSSILCFAYLNQSFANNLEASIHIFAPIINAPISWTDLLEYLTKETKLNWTKNDDFSRPCLGRVKLLWNSLRSSLPQQYFDPHIFRCRSLNEMHQAIAAKSNGQENILLKHNTNHNWLFSGDPKPKPLINA